MTIQCYMMRIQGVTRIIWILWSGEGRGKVERENLDNLQMRMQY